MLKVGAFEAKTHLSSLLDKVNNGEEVLITKCGKPIARLVPAEHFDQSRISTTINEIMTLRKEVTLHGMSWKELRDKGQR